MKLHIAEHRNASKIIPSVIQEEVKAAIVSSASLERATPARDSILTTLRDRKGWSDEVTLCADAKISITSRKRDVGLCIQTGNVSRFYADLLKLEYLYKRSLIHSALYLIPDKALAKQWGQNIAHFERFVKEVRIFSQIIHAPILVFGIRPLEK